MRMLGAVLLVAGLALGSAAASAQKGQLAVDNAWARATPGKSTTGAAYVTIRSPTADRLVAASTPAASKAELHTMSMSGMVMKMRPLAGVDIPAGQPRDPGAGRDAHHADRAEAAAEGRSELSADPEL